MSTSYADADVVCPYYQKSDNGYVQCEGIGGDDTATRLLFRDALTGKPMKDSKNEHMTSKCEHDYESCPVFKMLEGKYK